MLRDIWKQMKGFVKGVIVSLVVIEGLIIALFGVAWSDTRDELNEMKNKKNRRYE